MIVKPNYKFITKLTIAVALGSLVFVSLAPAQVQAQAQQVTQVTAADFNQAQTGAAACATFSTNLVQVTNKADQALWVNVPHQIGECHFFDYGVVLDQSKPWPSQQSTKASTDEKTLKANGFLNSNAVTTNQQNARILQVSSDPIVGAIMIALDAILRVVAAVLGVFGAGAGAVFSYAAGTALHINSMPNVVNVGWSIVRDICNMFFILILIVISFGTILRLEQYNYRHLLGKLIIMAILVNFSQVIAVTIMNAVNTLALIFYGNGFGTDIFSTLMRVADPLHAVTDFLHGGTQAVVSAGLGSLIYMLAAVVVFIVLAAMFVIRMVGLYVLIIFSPLAYVGSVLHQTEHYAKEWWEKFMKYLIWAPVALFMIRLNILVVKDTNTLFTGSDPTIQYWILIAFLAAAVIVAEEAGMVGSKYAMKALEKTGHAALELGDRYLARGATSSNRFRKAASYLSVGAWQKGRELVKHHKEEEAYTEAAGKRANTLAGIFGGPQDFERLAQLQRFRQEAKRFENVTEKEERTTLAEEDFKHGHVEALMGNWYGMAKEGDANEIPLKLRFTGDVAGMKEVLKKFAAGGDITKLDQKYMLMAAEISNMAKQAGDMNFAFATTRDATTGKIIFRDEDERQSQVATHIAKLPLQQRIRAFDRKGYQFTEQVQTNAAGQEIFTNIGITQGGYQELAGMQGQALAQFQSTPNVNTAANIVINLSDRLKNDNPELLAAAGNAVLNDSTVTVNAAGNITNVKGVLSTVAAPNVALDYTTSKTISRAVARDVIRRIETGKTADQIKDLKKNYSNFYNFANPPAAGAGPAGPAPAPAPAPTPPPGPAPTPGPIPAGPAAPPTP